VTERISKLYQGSTSEYNSCFCLEGHNTNQTMVEVSQLDIPTENVIWEAENLGQEVQNVTMEVLEKVTEEHGKYKDKLEEMEVSL